MTDKELPEALTALKTEATRLNSASDSINTIINAVEQQIGATNVGLECWLDLRTEEVCSRGPKQAHTDRVLQLGWTKISDRWRLATRWMMNEYNEAGDFDGVYPAIDEEDNEPYPYMALLSASREVRIQALELLAKLVAGLTHTARQANQTIEQAKKLVS